MSFDGIIDRVYNAGLSDGIWLSEQYKRATEAVNGLRAGWKHVSGPSTEDLGVAGAFLREYEKPEFQGRLRRVKPSDATAVQYIADIRSSTEEIKKYAEEHQSLFPSFFSTQDFTPKTLP